MKIYLFPFIIFMCFIASCDKTPANVPEPKIYFSGISKTEIDGSPLSAEDFTDWTAGDNWTAQETALFPNPGTSVCQPLLPYDVLGFPNPCQSIFQVHIDHADSIMLSYRIVDEYFNVLLSQDSLITKDFMLNFAAFGVHDTVRMYYKFFEAGCEFRGHGDVIIM